jgi:hypothetical protein
MPPRCSLKDKQPFKNTVCYDAYTGHIMGQKVTSSCRPAATQLPPSCRPASLLCPTTMTPATFLPPPAPPLLPHPLPPTNPVHWTALQTLVATTGMGALNALSCVQDILTQCAPLVNSIIWSGVWSAAAALRAAAVCAAIAA